MQATCVQSGSGHYNYFRDYDATIGRYLESDPIGLRGGLNQYSYVLSRPLMLQDRLGLFATADLGLMGHFFFGSGEYADISSHCAAYLRDPMVQSRTMLIKQKAQYEARSRGQGTFSVTQKDPLYVTSIYSFGAGTNHRQTVNCNVSTNGVATCKINYYAVDRYDDPLDLCQAHGFCGNVRNVFGTPFWFGLSCSQSFSFGGCR